MIVSGVPFLLVYPACSHSMVVALLFLTYAHVESFLDYLTYVVGVSRSETLLYMPSTTKKGTYL